MYTSAMDAKGVKSVIVGGGMFECEFIQSCAGAGSKMASCAGGPREIRLLSAYRTVKGGYMTKQQASSGAGQVGAVLNGRALL